MRVGLCTRCGRLYAMIEEAGVCASCGAWVVELEREEFMALARERWIGRKGGSRARADGDRPEEK